MFGFLKSEDTQIKEQLQAELEYYKKQVASMRETLAFFEFLGLSVKKIKTDGFDYEEHYKEKLKEAYVEISLMKKEIGKMKRENEKLNEIDKLLLETLEETNLENQVLKKENYELRKMLNLHQRAKAKPVRVTKKDIKEAKQKTINEVREASDEVEIPKPKRLSEIRDMLEKMELSNRINEYA